jgi:Uma2 family endonuclease
MAVERTEQLSPSRAATVSDGAARSATWPQPRLFDVDEYHRMAEAGILRPDERLELIDGEIRVMSPIGRRHFSAVMRLTKLCVLRLSENAEVSIQNPVRLRETFEPEPDVAILHPQPRAARPYETAPPGPGDVLLLIEVADSSVEWDLGEKAALYARDGVPELWVLDLPADRVVIHREPTAGGYASVAQLPRDGSVHPLAFPDVAFTADDLLGPPPSRDEAAVVTAEETSNRREPADE